MEQAETPEYLLIKQLESCKGWSQWFIPRQKKRIEAIEKELCGDVAWERTQELRMERNLLIKLTQETETAIRVAVKAQESL